MSLGNAWKRSMVLGIALLLVLAGWSAWTPALSSAPGEPKDLISYGSGPVEVVLFTDYFCAPCREIEPYLEMTLPALLRAGAQITFVDVPLSAHTTLYTRYFLYAANAAGGFDEVLHLRGVLADIAATGAAKSEQALLQRLQEKEIRLALLDVRPAFDRMAERIQRFGVRGTPTCVVTEPGREPRTFSGGRNIATGLDQLLHELHRPSPSKDIQSPAKPR